MSGPRIKVFHRTLLFYRLLRALIGGQANEGASSGNFRKYFPEKLDECWMSFVRDSGYFEGFGFK